MKARVPATKHRLLTKSIDRKEKWESSVEASQRTEMKSTVYHYYGPKRKNRCCGQFTVKNWALTSAIYTLVSFIFTKLPGLSMRSVYSSFLLPQPEHFRGDICPNLFSLPPQFCGFAFLWLKHKHNTVIPSHAFRYLPEGGSRKSFTQSLIRSVCASLTYVY